MKIASTCLCLALVCGGLETRASAQDAETQKPANEATPPPPDKTKINVEEPEAPPPEPPAKIGVGGRFRYIFLPKSVLELFLGHATAMNSFSLGAEVIRRKGNLDITFGLEYANISPSDGLYLEKNKDPSQASDYPDFVHFDNFGMISVDGTFIWHTDFTNWLSFRYGAGIGIGFLLGEIQKQKAQCSSTTTVDQLDDPNACPVPQGTTVRNADKPPVVPIINLLLGLRFKLHDEISLNI